jgi:predicted PurR-regulated permease PerM
MTAPQQNQLRKTLVPVWYGLLAVLVFVIIVALIYYNRYYFMIFISAGVFAYALFIIIVLWRHPGCFSKGLYRSVVHYSVFIFLIQILVCVVLGMLIYQKRLD